MSDIPDSIPPSAFLQPADLPGKAKGTPERLDSADQPLPSFCDADYENADQIGVRATQALHFASADAPADSTPKAAVNQDIIVFRGDGAEAFMADLRAAVESCPSASDDRKNYLRGPIGAGDDSVLIEQTRPAYGEDGEPALDGSLHRLFWAVVRVGDAISFVSNNGWEAASAEQADTVHLGERSAARLAAWRA